jgi:heat shock protein HtpX
MKFLKNIALMMMVNIAIVLTLTILLQVLGINQYFAGSDFQSLALFCLVWGMGASFISLLISKSIAKWTMKIQVVDPKDASPVGRKIYEMVRRSAERAGLPKIPEVGYYESPELNAFATGPSRSNSLVAVSSGLVNSMNDDELEGVIGHEVSHIANGDMVTMTLLQGVVNAMVMFLARVAGLIAGNFVEERSRHWVRFMVVIVAQMVLGILGVMITSSFSRRREYRADQGSANLVGRQKMIAALEALRDRQRVVDDRSPQMAAFKISGHSGGLMSLLSTHPPLELRIEALRRPS